jgi:CO/xanthine dehydrogenase Mo-binding subunit
VITGFSENGAGQHIVLSQVVAEILGLEPQEVAVVAADTEITPFDSGPGGSMGTVRVALAVQFAAEDARRQLLELAANRLEANVKDLEIGDHSVRVKGSPEKSVSLAALAAAAEYSQRGAIVGTGSDERQEWLAGGKARADISDNASFCTHVAKVEVDGRLARLPSWGMWRPRMLDALSIQQRPPARSTVQS